MPSIQVPDTILRSPSLPFLTIIYTSSTRTWDGLFTLHQQLSLTDSDLIPAVESLVETIVMSMVGGTKLRFSDLSREYKTTSTPLSNRQIQSAVDYIHTHLNSDLSLTDIAASAGLSVSHFSRLFRTAMGYSPYQYALRCRVQQAAILLKQHKYTIADIAQQVGFYDQSHLIRHFKRIYGVSPTKLFS